MKRTDAEAGNGQPRRWLLFEFAKLASLRNLAMAAIIALGSVLVVALVLHFAGPRNPAAAATANGTGQPPAMTTAEGWKLIPPTKEVLAMLPEHYDDPYGPSGMRELLLIANGEPLYRNDFTVEQGPGWDHRVFLGQDDKRYHTYHFTYKCGHREDGSPDAYHDLMYADPQAVADDCATRLCRSCQWALDHPDSKQNSSTGGKDGSAAAQPAKGSK